MRIDRALIALCFTTGCIDSVDTDASYDEVEQAIEVGTDDSNNTTRNAVVLLSVGCTGTLIAPDVVLTAAHCGFDASSFATGEWIPISPVTVFFGPNRSAPVATATANAVSVPPLATAGPWLVDDIALLRLTAPVAASVAIPRPTYVDRPVTLSSTSTIYQIGYGGGRNRRIMVGSDYRDWLLPDDRLMNAFGYTATIRGDGIGDRGTNIEGGDSGGPMLLGGASGFVMGDLSHWEPYGIATFGPGGEGRPSIRNWLQAKAPQRPDLELVSLGVAGCTGTGGNPTVRVTLRNRGVRTVSGWVDVFHGRTSAPTIGTTSTIFRSSGALAPHQTIDMSFAIPAGPGPRRIDVLLDTTRSHDELLETNNASFATLDLPDCSFN